MVELNLSSSLKKILSDLHKKGVISEKHFIRVLEDLNSSSSSTQNLLVPLIDMIGLLDIDTKIQRVEHSISEIESKIKETALAWEAGALSKDKTKSLLTKLVEEKNHLAHDWERFQSFLQTKVSRLKLLRKSSNFSIKEYISYLLRTDYDEKVPILTLEFKDVWDKYSKETDIDDYSKQGLHGLDDIEINILQSLIGPIDQEERIIFNLSDVIQPIEEDVGSRGSLFVHAEEKQNRVNGSIPKPELPFQETPLMSSWEVVGKVAFNNDNIPIGLFRPPIVVDGNIFLPIVMEESIPLSELKKGYKELLKQADLDLSVTTTQQIRNTIANSLKIPEKMALQPSFFNRWLSNFSGNLAPTKPVLAKVNFIGLDSMKDLSLEKIIIDEGELKQINVPVWIPASGNNVSDSSCIGKKIHGMAGSDFGVISGIMQETPFGQTFVVERKVPPSYLLDFYLEALGKHNLAELRYYIAKTLNGGEGEAYLAENLWKINYQERLLISPHEIASSYFTFLPTEAFIFGNEINAKIGVYFHSVPEIFRFLLGKPVKRAEKVIGSIYGFSIHQRSLDILWSSKTSDEIIKMLGRKSSDQYISRFKRRISMALGISYSESHWPSNLARYFLNFIWMEENQSLLEAQSMIEERFSLERISFSSIMKIMKEGIECK
ncbi:MAG: hypothetical protein ACXAC8_15585 [Candidatus Hodarchaeales archaeon]|jgi:hypothetical protein